MEPTQESIDQQFWEQVQRARQTEEKVLLGFEMFEQECREIAEGIRKQFPHASEARVQEILQNRLRVRREREYQGIYFKMPTKPEKR